MYTSSIYLSCPGCVATTLIDHRGPQVRCAACGFDYVAFRQDTPRYEQFLVDRMREGPGGQLGAAALHQWTSTLGVEESATSLRALAERHGVALPPPMTTDPVLRGALVVVVLIVVSVLGLVGYFIALGTP